MYKYFKSFESIAVFIDARAGISRAIILLLIFVAAQPVLAGAAEQYAVDVGPYVQVNSPSAASVYWDTPDVCNSIVEYGTTELLGLRAEDFSNTSAHKVILNNLQYRTKYYYRLGYSKGTTEHFTDIYTFDNAINYTRMDCSLSLIHI